MTSQFNYHYFLELPNIHIHRYEPRFRTKLDKLDYAVDMSCFEANESCLSSLDATVCSINSILIWELVVLTEWQTTHTTDFMKLFPTCITFDNLCAKHHTLFELINIVNNITAKTYRLQAITKADNLKACLSFGSPIIVGGSVYTSFETAEQSGLVPMPIPTESLLGGHAFCLVGYQHKTDTFQALANFGKTFGAAGQVAIHSKYLRNLNICRDFFTLTQVECYG